MSSTERELQNQISALRAEISALALRVEKLELAEEDEGVYLDGAPQFVKNYATKTKEDK